jgi:hypothetical protein
MVPDAATRHSVQAAAVSEVDVRSFNVAPGARQGKNDRQKIAEAEPPDQPPKPPSQKHFAAAGSTSRELTESAVHWFPRIHRLDAERLAPWATRFMNEAMTAAERHPSAAVPRTVDGYLTAVKST